MNNIEPLAVIINPPPSSVLQIYPQQTGELSIVVNNQDTQGMVVEVYLDIPERFRSWCKVSRTSFNLDGGRSQSVEFSWEIPPEAIPNRYRYDLVVDSPDLRAPLLYSLELEVLTPRQAPVSSHDPTFTIQPHTSSTHPIELKTSPLTIQALVHNRSNLVDSFRLTCPDLEDNWYTVRYPEGIQQQGLIAGEKKLSLNPNTQGQITLLLHPPENTIAGNYRPTIRLHSTVKPDLLLQDIFYLYISPVYKINVQLQTIREKIKNSSALYQIVALNEGNTIREIKFKPGSGQEEEICQYQIDPDKLKIPPGKTIAVGLKVKPTKKLVRPFFGAPKPINFQIDVEDIHQFPLPSYLPLKGFFLWETRPWWQLLLLILSGVITVSGLGFLIWWLFFRPPVLPEIISLDPAEKSYQFPQEIQVKFDIINPQRLKKITLIGKNQKGEEVIKPLTLTYEELLNDKKDQCGLISAQQETRLSCNNISTGATKPDSYIFTLNISAQKRWRVAEVGTENTSLITLAPPPTPTISNVGSPKDKYILPERVDLKFNISDPQELARVDLMKNGTKLTSIAPTDLGKICQTESEKKLNCHVQIPPLEPGKYSFSVDAIPKNINYVQPQGPVDAKKEVLVEEAKIPLIINYFLINDKNTSPIKIQPNEDVVVKWDVSGKDVKVTITGSSENLPPKGERKIPGNKIQPSDDGRQGLVTLKAEDAYGNTQTKDLFVQVESPTPSFPVPNSSPSPSSSSNLKQW
ncbi:conserved hypothetical protein [Gloeothece citriformis PCC 7424]|uniref:Uncharacterized protein n=1 Tax=Gloeothece citriformis (strain PCC 7424) TaxID=65393 RepID=B7KDT2_GLOC7|nr:hypothetical protein [Gloeothece citriformis]ACK70384.1 conserved hypothetical protein [Gloeothece citriformis PCC 7424]